MAAVSDAAKIREVVANWVLWRDGGDWERFATVWHPNGHMTATWFQGPAVEFVERSKAATEAGAHILHQIAGTSVDVAGDRAIAQTRMAILQRAEVDGVEIDVTCVGRFHDFFERPADRWVIRRRQPIYEQDRLDVVDPAAGLRLDPDLLARFPYGYRHLGYVQTKLGFPVALDLPGSTGDALRRLLDDGRHWLAGAPRPGPGMP
jgi:hypothetical protein